jgi:AcrR family transcriptional regulator
MPSRPNFTYHHGDLRRALINVSVDVIDKQGVDALNLRRLAVIAGVSSGAPYHHFASKADLLAAIAQEGFELLEASMLAQRNLVSTCSNARLEALGNAYVLFAMSHKGYFRVMFRVDQSSTASTGLSAAAEKAFRLLYETIEECQYAGTLPLGDPQPFVVHAWSTVHGLASLLVDGGLAKIQITPSILVPMITNLTSQLFNALAKTNASTTKAPFE